jgi:hypothetical protein
MSGSAPEDNAINTPTQVPSPDFGYEAEPHIRIHWKWSLLAAAMALLYFAWQCGSAFYFGSERADGAVRRFHDELNAGQFDQICLGAGAAFLKGRRRDQFIETLEAVHRKLGDVIGEERGRVNLNVNTEGIFVTVEFLTQFANDRAHETFTWRKSGNTLELYGYNVQSRAFLK